MVQGFVVPSIIGATENVLSSAGRAVPVFMPVVAFAISFMTVHIYSGFVLFCAMCWYRFGTRGVGNLVHRGGSRGDDQEASAKGRQFLIPGSGPHRPPWATRPLGIQDVPTQGDGGGVG